MGLPITTCRINVLRSDPSIDPMVDAVYLVRATGIPAVIHTNSGLERRGGGNQSETLGRLDVALGVDIRRYDRVVDTTSGHTWEIDWIRNRNGFGLDHQEAGVHLVEGALQNG